MYNVICQLVSVPQGIPPSPPPAGAIYTSSYTYNTVSKVYALLGTCYKAGNGAANRRAEEIREAGYTGKRAGESRGTTLKARGCRQANIGIN